MESIVYMDIDRIRAAGALPSFRKEEGNLVWSGTPNYAFYFLVMGGMLMIGAVLDHSELFSVHMTMSELADEHLSAKAKQIAHDAWHREYDGYVSGAGKIGRDGQITDWKSGCFRVDTPHYMKEAIEREVARLFHAGALTP